jgi:predicted transcriptional regulator
VENVFNAFKKDLALETNKITSVQNEQYLTETTDKVDSLQVEESPDTHDILDLSASFQKMRTEEQELLETKQALLKTQKDLQSKLVEEIDKKKKAIDELKLEIPAIQNRCRRLGRVLGVDIYS